MRAVRTAVVLSTVAMILACAAVTGGILANRNRINDVQASRLESWVSLCEARNADHEAIRGFVQLVSTNPKATQYAAVYFPLEMDCDGWAREQTDLP